MARHLLYCSHPHSESGTSKKKERQTTTTKEKTKMHITRYNQPETNVASELNRWVRGSFPGFGNLSKFFGFEDFLNTADTSRPSMDVFEDDSGVHLRLDLPGVKKEDVNIAFEDGVLEISATTKTEVSGDDGSENTEAFAYRRSVTIPDGTDTGEIKARLEHGVLEITLPKAEQRKPHQIAVE
jgi:HSP20 family protein